MTRLERAKQFMPFAALHGYEKVLKDKETVPDVKHELTEEDAKLLNDIILTLKKGDLVQADYYVGDKYVQNEGVITEIDCVLKKLRMVKTEINFENLRSIRLI